MCAARACPPQHTSNPDSSWLCVPVLPSCVQRLANEVTSYKARITSVVQDIITGPSTPSSLKAGAQQQQALAQPPPLDLALLERPGTPSGASAIAGLLEASPEAELAVLARSIQNTNETVRKVESLFSATNSTIELLQEGADERDQVQDEVSAALLQYADDLEQREAEQRAAMAAWEAEQARVAAEAAAYAAEQAAIAEAEVRRQEQEQAAARAAAEAAEREAERLAELERLRAPTCIKVDVGVQMKTRPGEDVVLVGSHPAFGSWDLEGALPLSWSDGHVWRASVEVAPDCDSLEYKAVVVSGGSPMWEKGSNQKVDLQGSKDVSLFHVFKA